ncbi:NEDD4 family-interacting protein 1-like [Styela clava]
MTRELSSSPRYTPLPSAPDDEPVNESLDQPPSYSDVASTSRNAPEQDETTEDATSDLPKWTGEATFVPPSYKAATTLPSYKDVEEQKEDEARFKLIDEMFHLSDSMHSNEPRLNGIEIGTDCLFIFAFLVAFLFNWIGLFVGYLIMYNLAGRYGSMSGFGMSMIKWLTYIKYSDCCNNYFISQHEYIWWSFVFISFVLMMKGMVCWMSVRRLRYSGQDCDEENARVVVIE